MKKMLLQPFHLASISPWPILMSLSSMLFMISSMDWFYNSNFSFFSIFCLLIILLILFQWWRDVIRESLYQGFHGFRVSCGLQLGMILFIISEIFFFLSIFWCYMHMYLSPSIDIGVSWPPDNIYTFNPYDVPLLNTIILLSSGVSITLCHYSLLKMNEFMAIFSLILTISLGILFTYFQVMEYKEAMYTISDSIFGSVFFFATGFHGFHVLLGTLFLLVNLIRMIKENYSNYHHFGFEAAAWYWHFVDVVWLFLYLLMYYLV